MKNVSQCIMATPMIGEPIKVNGEDWQSIHKTTGDKDIVHQAVRLSDPDPKPLYLVVADKMDATKLTQGDSRLMSEKVYGEECNHFKPEPRDSREYPYRVEVEEL